MTLLREYEPATRVGLFELDGLLSLLREKADEKALDGEVETMYYEGAYIALEIIRHHGRVEYPGAFMMLFEQILKERGMI